MYIIDINLQSNKLVANTWESKTIPIFMSATLKIIDHAGNQCS